MSTQSAQPLRDFPAFIRFWCGRLAATSANQMLMVAIGWQMYELTGSAWDLGLVGLYQFGPALLLVLWAAHVADRRERRLILAACMALQVAVVALLLTATLGGWASRGLLLALSLVIGAAKAFQMPAQQTRLRVLGYVTIHTRQLDMIMLNQADVEHYRGKILGDLEELTTSEQ